LHCSATGCSATGCSTTGCSATGCSTTGCIVAARCVGLSGGRGTEWRREIIGRSKGERERERERQLSREIIIVMSVSQSVRGPLCYKLIGRGFDPRWFHCCRTMATQHLTEMRTRNISWGEGGKGGRCLGLTTLPPSCADCLAIWEPHPPGTLSACPGR
jgi:hypothetical protein